MNWIFTPTRQCQRNIHPSSDEPKCHLQRGQYRSNVSTCHLSDRDNYLVITPLARSWTILKAAITRHSGPSKKAGDSDNIESLAPSNGQTISAAANILHDATANRS